MNTLPPSVPAIDPAMQQEPLSEPRGESIPLSERLAHDSLATGHFTGHLIFRLVDDEPDELLPARILRYLRLLNLRIAVVDDLDRYATTAATKRVIWHDGAG
jgi:hypothetical protein